MPEATPALRGDCARCVGLCCVAPAFVASADFAVDKPAGQPCGHLRPDFRCGIHDSLRNRGFPGCAVFDCFGAGQRATGLSAGGADWRAGPAAAAAMFDAFAVLRPLHELLWYLGQALELPAAVPFAGELAEARRETERLAGGTAEQLASVDVAGLRGRHGALLGRVSEAARAADRDPPPDRRGADLIGADLRRVDLRAAGLRGAYLVGADLRGVDLHAADLLGADLRAADVRGARLAGALFVTQPLLDAARGDGSTTIPAALRRPAHWSA
ncbi:MAG TPA: pentapeptide repeat-containing protein [Pseudonocardia sp.]|jgi:hypothetical protein